MKQASIYAARVRKLKERLEEEGLRGVVIVPGPNMGYLTGANSLLLERPFMLLIPVEGEPNLVAPALEAGPYIEGQLAMKVHPWTDSEGSAGAIAKAVKGVSLKGKWGVEGKVPFLFLDRLTKRASPKLRNAEPVLQGLRETKDEDEVRLLKKAATILSRSFDEFPGIIKEGATEMDVARAATDIIYAKGGTKVDDMLVQSGPRAADPHGLPTRRKLGRGDGVIIDVGSTFEGYYADITRTFCLGPSAELEKVYDRVLEAETSGIEKAMEGVRVGAVDAAAREVLSKAGMGKNFIHRTGHGLGLEVHEAPYIVEGGKERLGQNMCFTVEPGAYFRGKLGVRIEDDVLIEGRKGVEISDTPKEFGWWK
ncbi:MAG: aminopeptidase P family protein [Thaumarchaeota archaeon]|nr:aminopeptidase P family protein [Nitrososphaerota archaeon]